MGDVILFPGHQPAGDQQAQQPGDGAAPGQSGMQWPSWGLRPPDPADREIALAVAHVHGDIHAWTAWSAAEVDRNDRYRAAVEQLASTPAHDRQSLVRKCAAIGRVWLRADGPWFDKLRDGVARDVERLGTRWPAAMPARRPNRG